MSVENTQKPPMVINGQNVLALMETDLAEAAMRHYNTILEYPDMIERMEAQTRLIYAHYDGEELRDKMTTLDTNRRRKHDAAMASLNTMNKIAEKTGLEPVTDPVDFSDLHRSVVGDAICEHVKEVLDNDRYQEKLKNIPQRRVPDVSQIKQTNPSKAAQLDL